MPSLVSNRPTELLLSHITTFASRHLDPQDSPKKRANSDPQIDRDGLEATLHLLGIFCNRLLDNNENKGKENNECQSRSAVKKLGQDEFNEKREGRAGEIAEKIKGNERINVQDDFLKDKEIDQADEGRLLDRDTKLNPTSSLFNDHDKQHVLLAPETPDILCEEQDDDKTQFLPPKALKKPSKFVVPETQHALNEHENEMSGGDNSKNERKVGTKGGSEQRKLRITSNYKPLLTAEVSEKKRKVEPSTSSSKLCSPERRRRLKRVTRSNAFGLTVDEPLTKSQAEAMANMKQGKINAFLTNKTNSQKNARGIKADDRQLREAIKRSLAENSKNASAAESRKAREGNTDVEITNDGMIDEAPNNQHDSFNILPNRKAPQFAHITNTRRRDERAQMSGIECAECRNYYEMCQDNMSETQLKDLLKRCSKHRVNKRNDEKALLATSPQDIWKMEIGESPKTQTCDYSLIADRKRDEKKLRRRILIEQEDDDDFEA